MATFISHEDDKILFRTTGDERAIGLLVIVYGVLVSSFPLYGLTHFGAGRDARAFLLLVVFACVGIAEIAVGIAASLKSEWLTIDLDQRTYSGRRRRLLWGETLSGSLDDFDCVRLATVPCGRRGRGQRLVVDWVWHKDRHRPFRISTWGRQQSFRLAHRPSMEAGLDFLNSLRAVARDAGLPLVIPRQYLEDIGVADLELDGVEC